MAEDATLGAFGNDDVTHFVRFSFGGFPVACSGYFLFLKSERMEVDGVKFLVVVVVVVVVGLGSS